MPGPPVQPLPLFKGQVLPPRPLLYILGLFWACGAVSCPGEGVCCEGLAEAPAGSQSCGWCLLCAGSAQCLGLREQCHGHSGKTGSPGASPSPPTPGCPPPPAPSCSTLALRLHHLLYSFFPLHFFFWGRGEEGGGRTNLSTWMLGNKTLHKPVSGAACTSFPWG